MAMTQRTYEVWGCRVAHLKSTDQKDVSLLAVYEYQHASTSFDGEHVFEWRQLRLGRFTSDTLQAELDKLYKEHFVVLDVRDM